jgi:hypothetical protein
MQNYSCKLRILLTVLFIFVGILNLSCMELNSMKLQSGRVVTSSTKNQGRKRTRAEESSEASSELEPKKQHLVEGSQESDSEIEDQNTQHSPVFDPQWIETTADNPYFQLAKNYLLAVLKTQSTNRPASIEPSFSMCYCPEGTAPALAPEAFMDRVAKYFQCSDPCYIVALLYIYRVFVKDDIFYHFDYFSFPRIFLTAMVVAVKFYDDQHFKNIYYAQVGGFSIEELNRLEIRFLQAIKFDLYISREKWDLCIIGIMQALGLINEQDHSH